MDNINRESIEEIFGRYSHLTTSLPLSSYQEIVKWCKTGNKSFQR